MYAGNHTVVVRAYREHGDGNGSLTRTTILDTPTFIMGGIAGQAMYATDVVKSVIEMFGLTGASIYVNGDQSQSNNSEVVAHVSIYRYESE